MGPSLVSVPSDATSIDDVYFQQDFWSVAHMARFVRPGARRVATASSCSIGDGLAQAFRDDLAGTVTLILHNTFREQALGVTVTTQGNVSFRYEMPAWGTAIFVWPLEANETTANAPAMNGCPERWRVSLASPSAILSQTVAVGLAWLCARSFGPHGHSW